MLNSQIAKTAIAIKNDLIAEINSRPYGYCVHGEWVGGCGADYMCGGCEGGDDRSIQQMGYDAALYYIQTQRQEALGKFVISFAEMNSNDPVRVARHIIQAVHLHREGR